MVIGALAFSLALAPCNLPGIDEALRCGRLEVPENRARPATRRIGLNVVVLPATGRRRAPPLFDLAGGPGLAATDAATFFATDGKVHRRHRDVVLVDQRGTGRSNPLHCPALATRDKSLPMYPPELVRECRAALEGVADLSQYGTAQAVEDLEAVRRALRAPKIDLTGISYGTALAVAYARKYPRHVRAMALIGTVGYGKRLPLWHARNAQETMDAIVEDCLAQASCASAHPGLMITARQAREALEGTPRAEMLRNLMGTNSGQASVPLALRAAATGDAGAWSGLFKGGGGPRIAEGLYLSVVCPEDTTHIRPEEIAPAVAGTFLGDYRIREQLAACREWKLPPVRPAAKPARASPIPVLFLAGGRDHVTPPAWARETAQGFRPSRVVDIPPMAHFPDGLEGAGCLDEMLAAFFDEPVPGKVDAACVANMRPAEFRSP